MNLGIVGKRYEDIKIFIESNNIGETNTFTHALSSLGGMHNFLETESIYCNIVFFERGAKTAYILEDISKSNRTSYTKTICESFLSKGDIENINEMDWVHVCYIDDFENIDLISDISSPYSIDFCLSKDRKYFLDHMKKADIVFDSRERKNLYSNFKIETPIVLHDDSGCEIIVNGNKIYEDFCTTLKNITVNGAGDIYAKYFIEKHFFDKCSIKDSASFALDKTTKFLKNRNTQ
jgi:hypothetical protein